METNLKLKWTTNNIIIFFVALVAFPPKLVSSEALPGEDEEFCDYDENDDAQREDAATEPSFCQEVILNDTPSLYNQDDHNILAALATSVLNKTYPSQVDSADSFAIFDEMPYPVPTGATSFFMVLITIIFTWYFNKFIHWILRDTAKTLDLFPMTAHFPKVYLYMLQQSRRESRLLRDVRNTWGWLSTFYLLKPSDELVNAEEIFRSHGWSDFEVPHDVWGIIKAILRVNAADTTGVNNNANQVINETGKHEVTSENMISDKNLQIGKDGSGNSKRRLSAAEDLSHGQENQRLLLLRKLLGKKRGSFPNNDKDSSSESDDDSLPSMRDEALSLSLHPTTNESKNLEADK